MKSQIKPPMAIAVVIVLIAALAFGIYRVMQPHLPAGMVYNHVSPEAAKKAKNYNM